MKAVKIILIIILVCVLVYIENIGSNENMGTTDDVEKAKDFEQKILTTKTESEKLIETEYEKIRQSQQKEDVPEENINDNIDTKLTGNYPKLGITQITDVEPKQNGQETIIKPITNVDKLMLFIKQNKTYLIIADVVLLIILILLLFIPSCESNNKQNIITDSDLEISKRKPIIENKYPKNATIEETIKIIRKT